MNDPPCFSELECKILRDQINRRACYRMEFLRLRTDPCLHSLESGFVFDSAIQRFNSMKVTELEQFHANPRTITLGIMFILPFFALGFLAWKERSDREDKIRAGVLRYRDRLFKLQ